MCVCVCVCVSANVCVCVCVRMTAHVCELACECERMYVRVYLCASACCCVPMCVCVMLTCVNLSAYGCERALFSVLQCTASLMSLVMYILQFTELPCKTAKKHAVDCHHYMRNRCSNTFRQRVWCFPPTFRILKRLVATREPAMKCIKT